MNKLFLAACLTIVSSLFAVAQSDIKRAEFYAGYSNNQIEKGNGVTNDGTANNFGKRVSYNGFEAAAVGNFHRFFGIKGDFSATYRNKDFSNPIFTGNSTTTGTYNGRNKNSLYNFLGGVQVKDNNEDSRIKPFAHALLGVGYGRSEVRCSSTTASNGCATFNNFTSTSTGLAGAFGGGLDVRLSKRIGLRVIQVDYNPVHLDGQTLNNVRFGGGITF